MVPADDAFLCRVYASTRADELALTDWDDAEKAAFVRMQFDAQRAHYAEHYTGTSHHVIEVGGEPAGRLYVARWTEEIRIVDIALLPQFRRRGVGGDLLRRLLAEGAAAGKRVSIHVEKFNPARRLYERLGFVPAADRGVYELMVREPPGADAARAESR